MRKSLDKWYSACTASWGTLLPTVAGRGIRHAPAQGFIGLRAALIETTVHNSEIIEFTEQYCAAFRPGNSGGMVKYFHYPTTLIANGTSTQVSNANDLCSALAVNLSALEDAGFQYSEIQELNIHVLADNVALVSARYKRFKSNNQVLEEIAATYTLIREVELGWRIAVTIIHDADKLV